ncbi:MAG: FAD-binding oxidoreductase, partial [Chitinophagia bacterium]|nr:FAD-binding oxidoreductase [Chitinophagia bacterium]
MISYWEKAHFLAYEHIVVGAGIVGLSVAIELKHRYPNCSVLVLERGVLPTGASTRNAGFACMGSVTELLADLETMTETEVTALFAMRKQGLELLRSRLGDNTIDYAEYGSHEIITDNALHCLDKIPYINALLAPHTGNKPAFSIATHKIPDTGFNPQYAKALIANNCEGQLNSGKMMRALQHLASSKGVDILTGADVTSIQEEDGYVAVSVFDNTRQDSVIFTAKKLSICTNAFTKKLLPNEDI